MDTNKGKQAGNPATKSAPQARSERQKNLIALRNWTLSLLGIAIVIGVAWALLSSGGDGEPVEVRPYDLADTTDADVEATVDWLGVSNGRPAGATEEAERPAEPTQPQEEAEAEMQTPAETNEEITVETITPAPSPSSASTPAPEANGE